MSFPYQAPQAQAPGFGTPWSNPMANPFSAQFIQQLPTVNNPAAGTTGTNPFNLPLNFAGGGFMPDAPAAGGGGFMSNPWMTSLFGGQDASGFKTPGLLGPMAGLATAGVNAYLGLENLDLAKKSLKFEKEAFSKQFENQRTLTNASLRDRQIARDSATGRNTVDEYMRENGV